MCARRKEIFERTAEAIRNATGADVLAVPADVTRAEDVEAFIAQTLARFGRIDILVNNAGTSTAAGFEQADDTT